MEMMTMMTASKLFKVKDSLFERAGNDDIHFWIEAKHKHSILILTKHKYKKKCNGIFCNLNNLSFIIIINYNCIKSELKL